MMRFLVALAVIPLVTCSASVCLDLNSTQHIKDLKIDEFGQLFYIDIANDIFALRPNCGERVLVYNADVALPGDLKISVPTSLAFGVDSSGRSGLYIANSIGSEGVLFFLEFDFANLAILNAAAVPIEATYISELISAPNGDILAVEQAQAILRYNILTGETSTFLPFNSGIVDMFDIVTSQACPFLYISANDNDELWFCKDLNNGESCVPLTGSLLNSPYGVDIDCKCQVYVANDGNGYLRLFNPTIKARPTLQCAYEAEQVSAGVYINSDGALEVDSVSNGVASFRFPRSGTLWLKTKCAAGVTSSAWRINGDDVTFTATEEFVWREFGVPQSITNFFPLVEIESLTVGCELSQVFLGEAEDGLRLAGGFYSKECASAYVCASEFCMAGQASIIDVPDQGPALTSSCGSGDAGCSSTSARIVFDSAIFDSGARTLFLETSCLTSTSNSWVVNGKLVEFPISFDFTWHSVGLVDSAVVVLTPAEADCRIRGAYLGFAEGNNALPTMPYPCTCCVKDTTVFYTMFGDIFSVNVDGTRLRCSENFESTEFVDVRITNIAVSHTCTFQPTPPSTASPTPSTSPVGSIVCGQTVSGDTTAGNRLTATIAGASQGYTLVLTGSTVVQLSTCGNTPVDTEIAIVASNGVVVGQNDDGVGCALESFLELTVAAGTYTVFVGGHTTQDFGTYSLTLTCPSESPSSTPSPTSTRTQTPSASATQTPTSSASNTPSQTGTQTPTQTSTQTPTQSASQTPSRSATQTPTQTPSQSVTQTPTRSATQTPSPSVTSGGSIVCGQTVTGNTIGSPTLFDLDISSPVEGSQQTYTLVLLESTRVILSTCVGTNFDSTLGILNGLALVAFDNNGCSIANGPALIDTTLPAGTFTVVVGGFVGGPNAPAGAYSLSLTCPSASSTQTPTQTSTRTPSQTATQSPSQSSTQTATNSATQTASQSATQTPTRSATQTPSQSSTQTSTQSSTQTPSQSATQTPSQSATQTPTQTPTQTETQTPSQSSTRTASSTATATSSSTGTSSSSATQTPTSSVTPSRTASASITPSVTPTGTNVVSFTMSTLFAVGHETGGASQGNQQSGSRTFVAGRKIAVAIVLLRTVGTSTPQFVRFVGTNTLQSGVGGSVGSYPIVSRFRLYSAVASLRLATCPTQQPISSLSAFLQSRIVTFIAAFSGAPNSISTESAFCLQLDDVLDVECVPPAITLPVCDPLHTNVNTACPVPVRSRYTLGFVWGDEERPTIIENSVVIQMSPFSSASNPTFQGLATFQSHVTDATNPLLRTRLPLNSQVQVVRTLFPECSTAKTVSPGNCASAAATSELATTGITAKSSGFCFVPPNGFRNTCLQTTPSDFGCFCDECCYIFGDCCPDVEFCDASLLLGNECHENVIDPVTEANIGAVNPALPACVALCGAV